MARKRQEGVTTLPRYKGKMYAVAYGIFAGNKELAEEYADALSHARSQGVGTVSYTHLTLPTICSV